MLVKSEAVHKSRLEKIKSLEDRKRRISSLSSLKDNAGWQVLRDVISEVIKAQELEREGFWSTPFKDPYQEHQAMLRGRAGVYLAEALERIVGMVEKNDDHVSEINAAITAIRNEMKRIEEE